VGTLFFERPQPHYSGNFWWTHSMYVRKLHPGIDSVYAGPEFWLGKKLCRALSLFQSKTILYFKSITPQDYEYRRKECVQPVYVYEPSRIRYIQYHLPFLTSFLCTEMKVHVVLYKHKIGKSMRFQNLVHPLHDPCIFLVTKEYMELQDSLFPNSFPCRTWLSGLLFPFFLYDSPPIFSYFLQIVHLSNAFDQAKEPFPVYRVLWSVPLGSIISFIPCLAQSDITRVQIGPTGIPEKGEEKTCYTDITDTFFQTTSPPPTTGKDALVNEKFNIFELGDVEEEDKTGFSASLVLHVEKENNALFVEKQTVVMKAKEKMFYWKL